MKRILFFVALAIIATGCSADKDQEKLLLDTVIKTHDKLMADDGAIMKNKMSLKAFANPSSDIQDSITYYNKLLGNADDAMMNWMNKFSPDFTGKTHEQIMAYLNDQKAQVLKLDSQINNAVSSSNKFIQKVKTK